VQRGMSRAVLYTHAHTHMHTHTQTHARAHTHTHTIALARIIAHAPARNLAPTRPHNTTTTTIAWT
jgi:hypothetical protein